MHIVSGQEEVTQGLDKHQGHYFFIPGATTVGVVCSGGVILASEKRVSYGGLVVSRVGKKVFKVTDRIGVACAGLVSDMQMLVREIEAYASLFRLENGRLISVKAAAKVMSNILFSSSRYAPLLTQTIVGGVDEEGPSLYVLDVMGSAIPDKYNAVGSGAEIAIGLLEEGYKDGMTLDEGKALLTSAVKSAVSRDAMSGDGVDFLIITKDGVKEESVAF